MRVKVVSILFSSLILFSLIGGNHARVAAAANHGPLVATIWPWPPIGCVRNCVS